MITTPLKIGIAVACLVGIAAIIAVDQVRLQRRESMTITTVAPTIQTALPPVVAPVAAPVVVAPAAADPVICPTPAAPAAEAPAKPAPAPVKELDRVYTVVQGDSLYGISTKVFGTPRHYERIYEANRDRIKDPNTLQVGINLKMPEVAAKPAQYQAGSGSGQRLVGRLLQERHDLLKLLPKGTLNRPDLIGGQLHQAPQRPRHDGGIPELLDLERAGQRKGDVADAIPVHRFPPLILRVAQGAIQFLDHLGEAKAEGERRLLLARFRIHRLAPSPLLAGQYITVFPAGSQTLPDERARCSGCCTFPRHVLDWAEMPPLAPE